MEVAPCSMNSFEVQFPDKLFGLHSLKFRFHDIELFCEVTKCIHLHGFYYTPYK